MATDRAPCTVGAPDVRRRTRSEIWNGRLRRALQKSCASRREDQCLTICHGSTGSADFARRPPAWLWFASRWRNPLCGGNFSRSSAAGPLWLSGPCRITLAGSCSIAPLSGSDPPRDRGPFDRHRTSGGAGGPAAVHRAGSVAWWRDRGPDGYVWRGGWSPGSPPARSARSGCPPLAGRRSKRLTYRQVPRQPGARPVDGRQMQSRRRWSVTVVRHQRAATRSCCAGW